MMVNCDEFERFSCTLCADFQIRQMFSQEVTFPNENATNLLTLAFLLNQFLLWMKNQRLFNLNSHVFVFNLTLFISFQPSPSISENDDEVKAGSVGVSTVKERFQCGDGETPSVVLSHPK